MSRAGQRQAVVLPPVSADLLTRLHDVLGQADRAALLFARRLRAHDDVIDELAAYINTGPKGRP